MSFGRRQVPDEYQWHQAQARVAQLLQEALKTQETLTRQW